MARLGAHLWCPKLCLDKGKANNEGRALEPKSSLSPHRACLLHLSASTLRGPVSLKTGLPSVFGWVSCPCAGWSLNCRFHLSSPHHVSYCWCSVPPVSVDADPKITLRLASLVGSRCAGSTARLAAEKGDVLAPLSLERVSSS